MNCQDFETRCIEIWSFSSSRSRMHFCISYGRSVSSICTFIGPPYLVFCMQILVIFDFLYNLNAKVHFKGEPRPLRRCSLQKIDMTFTAVCRHASEPIGMLCIFELCTDWYNFCLIHLFFQSPTDEEGEPDFREPENDPDCGPSRKTPTFIIKWAEKTIVLVKTALLL